MHSNDPVLILAGGLGTRLKSIISDKPKPMADINGRPFISHLVNFWISEGHQSFILLTGYEHNQITDYFCKNQHDADIEFSVEKTPLGTGGALLKALNDFEINKRFILINGDTYFPLNTSLFINFHETKKSDLSIALFASKDTNRYKRICINNNCKVTNILPSDKTFYVNGGTYIFDPRVIEYLKSNFTANFSSFENDILPELFSNFNSHGFHSSSKFIDIGLPEDYNHAHKFFE